VKLCQKLVRREQEASTRCGADSLSGTSSGANTDSSPWCSDTLIASFNSLLSAKNSLLFKNNSLLRTLGNIGKKHRNLLRFLTSLKSNQIRNRCISLHFPCRSGNSDLETGSQQTAPSAMESAHTEIFGNTLAMALRLRLLHSERSF
jgi:hypothetical protein